jgi:hypothetical protein
MDDMIWQASTWFAFMIGRRGPKSLGSIIRTVVQDYTITTLETKNSGRREFLQNRCFPSNI